MCRWFVYLSATEPCLLEDILVTPAHALSRQVNEHYLPKLLSHNPSAHAEPTTEAEIKIRNRLFNVDGFGMAWYTSSFTDFAPPSTTSRSAKPSLHPALYKTIQPPLHDSNFRSICANTSSKGVFAHIRAATATAITPTNNHPFTFGIHTIMHNGYISDFTKIKRAMCNAMTHAAYTHIQGGTDTEHFAALMMSFLCPGELDSTLDLLRGTDAGEDLPAGWEQCHTSEQMLAALQKTIATIISLQVSTLGSAAQPNDLNIAITDGCNLVASRFRNHATEQPPSLYYSTKAGITLNRQYPDNPDGKVVPQSGKLGESLSRKEAAGGEAADYPHITKAASQHGAHIIVASEPITYKVRDWELISKNHAVLLNDGIVELRSIVY